MVAYFRSNFSITGAEFLDWARRLAGDRQLPPWLHRVEAEQTRNERRADEKLLDRFVWLRTDDGKGAETEAVSVEAILEREEESLVEAERTPEVARRYMAANQNSWNDWENLPDQKKKDQNETLENGMFDLKKIVEGTKERDREISSSFWKSRLWDLTENLLKGTHSLIYNVKAT